MQPILTKPAELLGQMIPRNRKNLLEIFSLFFSLIFDADT